MHSRQARRRVLLIGALLALALVGSTGTAYATTYSIQGSVSHTSGDWDHAAISAVPYHYNYVVTNVKADGTKVWGWQWQSVDAEGSSVATDGTYSIDGLEAGTYRVGFSDASTVYQPVYYSDATTVGAGTDVNVATATVPGSATGVNQSLTPYPTRQISGHVNFVGAPAISGDVSADIYSQDASGTWDVAYTMPVNDDGTYVVHLESAGTYRVGFSDAAGLFPDVFYNGASTIESATTVAVVDGSPVSGVDGTMTAAPSMRWGGTDTIATAIQISQTRFDDGIAGPVLIASADTPFDALASAPLAHELNCPILLVHRSGVSPRVITELERLDAEEVIIIGGASAVSIRDEMALRAAGIPVVRRLSGADRFGTSVAVAQEMVNRGLVLYDEFGNLMNIAVASGDNFNDAELGAAAAAAQDMPLVLVQKKSVPSVVAKFLAANETSNTQVLAIGGTGSIKSSTLAKTAIAADATTDDPHPSPLDNVNRIGGSDAFRTSVAVADYEVNELGWGNRSVVLASGNDFASAIAAGPMLAEGGKPLLLTAPALKRVKVAGSPKPYGYTQLSPATEVYISKQTTPSIDAAGVGYESMDDTSTVLRNFSIARIDALGTVTALPTKVWNYALTVAQIAH